MLNILLAVIRRDLLLAWRRRTDVFTTLVFFVIVASLFPLGVGPEANLLRTMAPGVLWVSALLATLLSVTRLFAADYADGTLEQMLLSTEPLPLIVLGKVSAYWLVTGLPLVLLAPLLGSNLTCRKARSGCCLYPWRSVRQRFRCWEASVLR